MKQNPLTPARITTFIRRTLHPQNQTIHLAGQTSQLTQALYQGLSTNAFRELEATTSPDTVATVLYLPPRYLANNLIFNQILNLKKVLRLEGKFWMVTTKSTGGLQFTKMVSEIFGNTQMEVGSGGLRLVSATKTDQDLPDLRPVQREVSVQIAGQKLKLQTYTSSFSATELDAGAKLLLEETEKPIKQARYILDLGCGWGAIGLGAAILNPQAQVTLVDIDPKALKAATENTRRLHLEDRVQIYNHLQLHHKFDLVLTNPPFHLDSDSLLKLLEETQAIMAPGALLYASVEKTYITKFEKLLQKVFGQVEQTTHSQESFVLLKTYKKRLS